MSAEPSASDLEEFFRLNVSFDHSQGLVLETRKYADRVRKVRNAIKTTKWKNTKCIGRGASGTVWLQSEDGRSANCRAVKEIVKGTRSVPLPIDYRKELVALGRLSKNDDVFVNFFGWYESLDAVYLAMEYFEHGDLAQNLDAKIAEPDARIIAKQLLEGLTLLHSQEWAHRDLKPQNIFVVEKRPWWVKIGDFGISKRIHDGMTRFHTTIGTPDYIAPEVLHLLDEEDDDNSSGEDDETYTVAVDMWSLGCVLYQIMTLELPFANRRKLKSYCRAKHQKFPKSALEKNDASTSGIEYIQALLEPHPSQRMSAQTALQLPWAAQAEDHISDQRRSIDSLQHSDLTREEQNDQFSIYEKATMSQAQFAPITPPLTLEGTDLAQLSPSTPMADTSTHQSQVSSEAVTISTQLQGPTPSRTPTSESDTRTSQKIQAELRALEKPRYLESPDSKDAPRAIASEELAHPNTSANELQEASPLESRLQGNDFEFIRGSAPPSGVPLSRETKAIELADRSPATHDVGNAKLGFSTNASDRMVSPTNNSDPLPKVDARYALHDIGKTAEQRPYSKLTQAAHGYPLEESLLGAPSSARKEASGNSIPVIHIDDVSSSQSQEIMARAASMEQINSPPEAPLGAGETPKPDRSDSQTMIANRLPSESNLIDIHHDTRGSDAQGEREHRRGDVDQSTPRAKRDESKGQESPRAEELPTSFPPRLPLDAPTAVTSSGHFHDEPATYRMPGSWSDLPIFPNEPDDRPKSPLRPTQSENEGPSELFDEASIRDLQLRSKQVPDLEKGLPLRDGRQQADTATSGNETSILSSSGIKQAVKTNITTSVKSGDLMMFKPGSGNSETHSFRLVNNKLLYPLGAIDIEKAEILTEQAGQHPERRFRILAVGNALAHVFEAPSEIEKSSWIDSLAKCEGVTYPIIQASLQQDLVEKAKAIYSPLEHQKPLKTGWLYILIPGDSELGRRSHFKLFRGHLFYFNLSDGHLAGSVPLSGSVMGYAERQFTSAAVTPSDLNAATATKVTDLGFFITQSNGGKICLCSGSAEGDFDWMEALLCRRSSRPSDSVHWQEPADRCQAFIARYNNDTSAVMSRPKTESVQKCIVKSKDGHLWACDDSRGIYWHQSSYTVQIQASQLVSTVNDQPINSESIRGAVIWCCNNLESLLFAVDLPGHSRFFATWDSVHATAFRHAFARAGGMIALDSGPCAGLDKSSPIFENLAGGVSMSKMTWIEERSILRDGGEAATLPTISFRVESTGVWDRGRRIRRKVLKEGYLNQVSRTQGGDLRGYYELVGPFLICHDQAGPRRKTRDIFYLNAANYEYKIQAEAMTAHHLSNGLDLEIRVRAISRFNRAKPFLNRSVEITLKTQSPEERESWRRWLQFAVNLSQEVSCAPVEALWPTLGVSLLPPDTKLEDLRALFSAQSGFKHLYFNDAVYPQECIVEFKTTRKATAACAKLQKPKRYRGITNDMSINPVIQCDDRCGPETSPQYVYADKKKSLFDRLNPVKK
ncbi:uncharacterized protein KY384_003557 [Bacidia gigantensis]|uniref:uncharacterized protein n=1 Tax=Bacidia gigantensis TaxID=2732470 RepID=UPI001D0389EC|nr:uncharacterized protein KY384_003557 [Bacidia gigantensis]KAG8531921.1 hypothetical protein KY384_003557 [Bacidia gigantensis]